MQVHNLKIDEEYAIAKVRGLKLFEVRNNDRKFKEGDICCYKVNGDWRKTNLLAKQVELKLYRITYVTNYNQKEGYVVYGEKEVK